MPSPTSRRLAVIAVLAAAAALPSSTAAAPKIKDCGTITAGEQRFDVEVQLDGVKKGQTPYSCTLAKGVIKAFHRTSPSNGPVSSVRYQGKKWDCYVIRDSSGYNCFSPNLKVQRGTMTGLFV